MNGEQRREKIIDILNSSSKPVSGVALASMLNVSRQVIVQDQLTGDMLSVRRMNIQEYLRSFIQRQMQKQSLTVLLIWVAGLKMCSYITKYTELLRQILICTQGVILKIIWQRLEMESLIC